MRTLKQLTTKRHIILYEIISSLNTKNSLLIKVYLYKWLRKTRVNESRYMIKGNKEIIYYLRRNIYSNIIDKIKKEYNRRTLIIMFLHIRNLQTPTLFKAMEKIINYSNFKTQVLNAYAAFIQSYYRMKKNQKAILLQITTTKIRKFNKKMEIKNSHQIQSNNMINKQKEKETIINNYIELDPRKTFAYLARRILIKTIVYTLMVAC